MRLHHHQPQGPFPKKPISHPHIPRPTTKPQPPFPVLHHPQNDSVPLPLLHHHHQNDPVTPPTNKPAPNASSAPYYPPSPPAPNQQRPNAGAPPSKPANRKNCAHKQTNTIGNDLGNKLNQTKGGERSRWCGKGGRGRLGLRR